MQYVFDKKKGIRRVGKKHPMDTNDGNVFSVEIKDCCYLKIWQLFGCQPK
jgi:hypothetical protein